MKCDAKLYQYQVVVGHLNSSFPCLRRLGRLGGGKGFLRVIVQVLSSCYLFCFVWLSLSIVFIVSLKWEID